MKVLERLVDSINRKMNSSAIKRGSEEWRTFNSVLQQAKKGTQSKHLFHCCFIMIAKQIRSLSSVSSSSVSSVSGYRTSFILFLICKEISGYNPILINSNNELS